jgi:hypothetical protein
MREKSILIEEFDLQELMKLTGGVQAQGGVWSSAYVPPTPIRPVNGGGGGIGSPLPFVLGPIYPPGIQLPGYVPDRKPPGNGL